MNMNDSIVGPQLLLVPPNDLNAWIQAEPLLAPAIATSKDVNLEDTRAQYANGQVGLLLCLDEAKQVIGALVIERTKYPRRTLLVIHFFGAKAHTDEIWMEHLWPQLVQFAKGAECDAVVATGRPGWARKLKCGTDRRLFEWEV